MSEHGTTTTSAADIIAIVGAGNIGLAFAVVHASAGRYVQIYEKEAKTRAGITPRLTYIFADLAEFGLIDELPEVVRARIDIAGTPEEALAGAVLVHECVPENLRTKSRITKLIADRTPEHAPILSATSAIPASSYASTVKTKQRCLVAHPGNPPFLLKIVELVPAPFTCPNAIRLTKRNLEAAGLTVILVRKEIKGFVFNRLQGALLREAYCLVRDGVANVEEIDSLVRDGLGLRWSVVGPFETVDLNTTGGIEKHAELLGAAYASMGADRGQHDPWTRDLVDTVTSQRRAIMPLEKRAERIRWRDRQLMAVLMARHLHK